MRQTPASNTLYYGDNLRILRDHIADESVDLIYLDPPFDEAIKRLREESP
jgi:16S rRNA G966 N2-methylase RsmD